MAGLIIDKTPCTPFRLGLPVCQGSFDGHTGIFMPIVRKMEVYVIDDPRSFNPECGHFHEAKSAYEDLAMTLIYNKDRERRNQGRSTWPSKKYDEDENSERNMDYVMLLERRLGRWLRWLDTKDLDKPKNSKPDRILWDHVKDER
jgi:hypothetical protein